MSKIYPDWLCMFQLYWHKRIMCRCIYFQKLCGFIFLSRECHLLRHYPELDFCMFCLPGEKILATFITLSSVIFSVSAKCIPVGIPFDEEIGPLQSLMSVLCWLFTPECHCLLMRLYWSQLACYMKFFLLSSCCEHN